MSASPDRSIAIRVEHLTKRYGAFTAVDDLSLDVAEGDFFGFLGPNGAGKTTTINAIVGLAKYQHGSIRIFGHDIATDWRIARPLIGLAPQDYNFDRFLSTRDILIFQAGYYGLRGPKIRARADELLERFGLTSKAKDTFMKLSGGMKRRLTLARALIHSPRLLILDEPTAGVDVELRIELWDLLRELNAGGMTIVLTTHYLEEAEALCRNIAIVESGKIVARESTSDLLRSEPSTLHVTIDRVLERVPPSLAGTRSHIDGTTIVFEGIEPRRVALVLQALAAEGCDIRGVEFKRATLQDVFLELVRQA